MKMMTVDEIENAIRGWIRVRFQGMIFSNVRSWRKTLKRRGGVKEEWIVSLELVERRRRADGLGTYETVIWAAADECEAVAVRGGGAQ